MLAREGVKGASLYPALTMDTDYSISYNNCWLSKWAQKKVDGGKGELAGALPKNISFRYKNNCYIVRNDKMKTFLFKKRKKYHLL